MARKNVVKDRNFYYKKARKRLGGLIYRAPYPDGEITKEGLECTATPSGKLNIETCAKFRLIDDEQLNTWDYCEGRCAFKETRWL